MREEWKPIDGYEGLYEISSKGRVKSLPKCGRNARILFEGYNKYGYKSVVLCKNGIYKRYLIHRLVATAFIENPKNLPEVNHRDENKENNRVENLEWCDHRYNINYGSKIVRQKKTCRIKGSRH